MAAVVFLCNALSFLCVPQGTFSAFGIHLVLCGERVLNTYASGVGHAPA